MPCFNHIIVLFSMIIYISMPGCSIPANKNKDSERLNNPVTHDVSGNDRIQPENLSTVLPMDMDSGVFGKWIEDRYGLTAYKYEMDPLKDDRAKWMKGDESSILHWHQLGNYRINAIAANLGFVQLFYNDSAQRWLNYYYPENLAFAGGFGIMACDDQVFTTYRPLQPGNTHMDMIFGAGYYEKEMVAGQVRLNETTYVPFGDLPVLIMRVRLKNLASERKVLTYIPYFDVAPYSLHPPFLTAFLPEEVGLLMSKLKRFNLDIFPEDSLIIARSKKKSGKKGGYPKGPKLIDPELPDIFFTALGHQAHGAIVHPQEIFTKGRLNENFMHMEYGWPESYRFSRKPEDICFSLPTEIEIAPEEERTLYFAYGYAKAEQPEDIIKEIGDPEKRFEETILSWKESRPVLQLDENHFLTRELAWSDYYLVSSLLFDAYYNESFVPQAGNYLYFAGVHGAMRDFAAHILALSYYHPGLARDMLALCMKNQEQTGRLFYDFEGYGSRSIGGALPFSGLLDYRPSDLSLWFLWAVCEYVFATRDFGFLQEEYLFWPKKDEEKGTVLEHAIRAYRHLEEDIGTGKHGLIQLRKSDWNDEMASIVSNGKKLDYLLTTTGGESHLNTAMACYILPMFENILRHQGDHVNADRVSDFYNKQKIALKKEWLDTGWFPRAYSALGQELGKDNIYLEPQVWALLSEGILDEAQTNLLIENIDDMLRKPSALGMMISSSIEGSPTCEPGEAEAGGIWFAINGPGALALSFYDPVMGYEELLHNTLSWHASKYPDIWFGIWSGPDAFNSVFSKRPGQTWDSGIGPQYWPVQNSHAHCQLLWTMARMAGFEPNLKGYKIRPLLPLTRYSFSTSCLGLDKDSAHIGGWFKFDVSNQMEIQVILPEEITGIRVEVDGQDMAFKQKSGEIVFPMAFQAGQRSSWKVLF